MKSVKIQVWSQVEDQFWNPVLEQVELANFNQVWIQVEDPVWNMFWDPDLIRRDQP